MSAETLHVVCQHLANDDRETARELLVQHYPFVPVAKKARRYTDLQSARIFARDGFIDRYSGERLVYPGALRALSLIFPDEFPHHPNWAMDRTHRAFWKLFPTIDHVVPFARGGADDETNDATTSMMRNQIKAHWRLEEIGWSLHPPGARLAWDGLMGWFIDYVAKYPDLLETPYIRR